MLEVISLEEARSVVTGRFGYTVEAGGDAALTGGFAGEETVALADAAGRVLAADIVSVEGVPPFDRSTVDGFAVVASDTFGCSDALPALLGLAGEVDILEEREHHLWVCAPPHGAADEDGVVLAEVGGGTFVGRQLAFVGLFLRQVDKRCIGHAVVLVGDDLVLVGTRDFADVVGHNLGVANLDVCYVVGSVVADYIVVARVGEEDDYFIHCLTV